MKVSAFDAGFGSEIGKALERFDEFWPTIAITAVIDGVHPEKNVISWDYFRPGKRVSEENGVACRDVCNRNPMRDFRFRTLLRHIDIIRQRRAAEDAQVDICNAMFLCA